MRYFIAVLITALLCAQSASAQTISDRLRALEQAQSGGDSQLAEEMLYRLDELQREVQELRSRVEEQSFEIERLKTQQRDQYLDLDQRVADLAQRDSSAPPAVNGNTVTAINPTPTGNPAPVNDPPPDGQPIPVEPDGGIGDGAGPPPDSNQPPVTTDAERTAYEQAFSLLRDGRYADAARSFGNFLESYPRGEFADNAQYWLGESYYVTGNYEIALDAFRRLIDQFPQSPKIPDAKLKIGYTYYELEQWSQAQTALQAVVTEYPDSTVARLADSRLRSLRLEGHGGGQ